MLPARLQHWTFRYAYDRIRLLAFEVRHPEAPWLAPDAVRFLHEWIKPQHSGFEWGAGRSTTWLSRRVRSLTSIEHNYSWYQRVEKKLSCQSLENVELRYVPVENDAPDRYVHAIANCSDESLDFVLVDGVSELRDRCALAAIPKIRAGGVIIVDDIHRYLPSASRSPLSRSPQAGAGTPEWALVASQVKRWDCRVFSSGVTDTGIWIRAR